MSSERLQNVLEFDPQAMAELEINAQINEIDGDAEKKFKNHVLSNQMLNGVSEACAYKLQFLLDKSNKDELTPIEKREALVEYYETLSKESGLGFDPFAAAFADEKLKDAKNKDNNEVTALRFAELYSVVFSKPAENFMEFGRSRVDFINIFVEELSFALMQSPSFFLNSEEGLRNDLRTKIDFEKMKKASLRSWQALKDALLK